MARLSRFFMSSLVLASTLGAVSVQAATWSSLQGAEAKKPTLATKPANSSATQLLFTEIEVLKQEIQTLQSKVEEQSNELRKIKKEQKERYLDLDRRLGQVLSKSAATPVLSSADSQGKSVYDAAFQLMKNKKLSDAALGFQSFLTQFPKSTLVVNGYYWLGQIYYIQANLDEARKAFTIVMNQFPNHAKTPDSKYKLGVVLHRLGDTVQAKRLLNSVVKQYANSGSARFAKKYLKENFSK